MTERSYKFFIEGRCSEKTSRDISKEISGHWAKMRAQQALGEVKEFSKASKNLKMHEINLQVAMQNFKHFKLITRNLEIQHGFSRFSRNLKVAENIYTS